MRFPRLIGTTGSNLPCPIKRSNFSNLLLFIKPSLSTGKKPDKATTELNPSGSDNTVTLRPPKQLSLDQYIEFIAEDELVEITPENIRLRKMELDQNKRASQKKKEKFASQ